jgi:isoquinoline 1-oxidoreductase subunit beta
MSATFTRDTFLKVSTAFGAGLTLGFAATGRARAAQAAVFTPNAFVKIAPENAVTIYVSKSEMGQGIAMGLATIVAEELDYPVERTHIEFAIAGPQYVDPVSKEQGTGGSTSTEHFYDTLRTTGASARAMLIGAAAQKWSVPAASLVTTGDGFVFDAASGRRASYGELALLAALQPVPKDVKLKSPAQFTQIGRRKQRYDIPLKVNGRAKYGMDVRLPGMLYASVQRPPVFGGSVASYDARNALKVKGVKKVVKISRGVAVLADNSWSAAQGRYALAMHYNDGPNAQLSSAQISAEAEKLTKQKGAVAKKTGNVEAAFSAPNVKTFSALYTGPYLAHAAMEPMNATAWIHDGICEVWAPTQGQSAAQRMASTITGLPLSACKIYTTFLGGGFGRKSEPDAVQEAVEIAKAAGAPVKVVWTREDDMQHDFYRSANTTAVAAVLDPSGKIVGMTQRVVASSILRRARPERFKDGLDVGATRGASDMPYAVPNYLVDYVDYEPGVPVGFWRAPGSNWGTFVTESFVDELAHAAGADPYAFRRAHLVDKRAIAVLDAATEHAGWGKPIPAGRHRGLAMGVWGEGSRVAMVAEISVDGKVPRVRRLVIASDTGIVINPGMVEAQLRSAAIYGLSAALSGKITIERGRVAQNNFNDYTVLRHPEAPAIETVLIPSTEKPSGVGELSTPPVAPAVANAWFAATGKRLRSLPFSDAKTT